MAYGRSCLFSQPTAVVANSCRGDASFGEFDFVPFGLGILCEFRAIAPTQTNIFSMSLPGHDQSFPLDSLSLGDWGILFLPFGKRPLVKFDLCLRVWWLVSHAMMNHFWAAQEA